MPRATAHQNLICLARNAHVRVACQTVPQSHVRIERGTALVEDRRDQIGAQPDFSAIWRLFPQQHLQQRRLANAVGPDKGHPIAALHAQVELC